MGERFVSVSPGVKVSYGGSHVGLGVLLPASPGRESNFAALAQLGYHVTWESVFSPS